MVKTMTKYVQSRRDDGSLEYIRVDDDACKLRSRSRTPPRWAWRVDELRLSPNAREEVPPLLRLLPF